MSRFIYFLDRFRSIWFRITSLCLRAFQAGGKAGGMEWNGDESGLLRTNLQGGEQVEWQDVITYALGLRSPWCLSAPVQQD